jgi:EF hand
MRLLTHIYEVREQKTLPNQPVARDMFDIIDIKKDGLIDFYEWRQAFELDKWNGQEDFLFGRQMQE